MALKTQVESLRDNLTDVLADAEKADNGNKAATTRVRTAMQNVKKQAQEIRETALELQKG